MRTALRLSLLAGVALAGVTCTESPTAPRTTLATVAIAPSFSRDAVQAWQSLAAFNMAANNLRVVLRRPGPPEVILKDTVVSIAPGQTVISIELTVAAAVNEQLGAYVQLRDGNAVLFEGTSSVTVAPTIGGSTGGGGGNVDVPIAYVGPGATATRIRISPRDQVVAAGAQVSFSVSATDANGQPQTSPPVKWSVSDATIGQVDASTGLFVAANRRGTTSVIARTVNGLADSVTATVVPPPQRLVVVSGDGQAAVAGRALPQPMVVELQATDGLPLAGASITFAASEGASIAPATATTDASGRASATMTLGRTPGSNTFTATAAGVSAATVTATGTQPPPAAIASVSGDAQTGAVGTAAAQPLVVRVTDEFGAPVSGATVTWSVVSGGGSISGAGSTTGSDGLSQVTYTFGNQPGPVSVRAAVTTPTGSAAATFALTARSGSVATLTAVSGQSQGGIPGTVLQPFVVKAVDALGNPVPDATIAWRATATAGTLNAAQSTTGADGTASVTLTLGTVAGQVTVTASAGSGAAAASFVAVIRPGAPAKLGFLVQPASSIVSTNVDQVRVEIRDAYNNRVTTASDSITLAIASGTGTSGAGVYGPPGPPVVPGAHAVAGVAVISYGIDKAGTGYRLDASSVTTTTLVTARSNSFAVTVGPPKHASVSGTDAFSGTAGSTLPTPLVAQINDAGGNPVPAGVRVTFKVQSGGGSLDAGGGVIGTTVLASTDVNGRASVSWTLGTTGSQMATAYIDDGSGNSAGTMAQYTASIVAAGAQLAVVSQPLATIASQSLFPSPIVVQLLDSTGANLAAAGVPVTMSVNELAGFRAAARTAGTVARRSGSGVLGAVAASAGTASLMCPTCGTTAFIGSGAPGGNAATVTLVTDPAGQASFSNVGLAGRTGTYVLAFTSGTMPSAHSPIFSLTAGPPDSLVVGYDGTFDAGDQLLQDYPYAIVVDSVMNGVEGVSVSIVVASGGGLVDTTMRSSGPGGDVDITDWKLGAVSGLGPTLNEVKVTASSLPNSPFVTLRANAMQPKKLGAGTSESPFPSSVVSGTSVGAFMIQAYDSAGPAGGHLMHKSGMTVAVKLLDTTGFTLTGTLSDTTDEQGSVTFSTLVLTGSGTAHLAFYGNDGAVPFDTLYKTVSVLATAPAVMNTMGANWLVTQANKTASTPPTSSGVTAKDEAGARMGGGGNFVTIGSG